MTEFPPKDLETNSERLMKTAMGKVAHSHACPVCGYKLDFAPWRDEAASHEICPCCGIQFGYHDTVVFDDDEPREREVIWAEWRER